MTSKHVHARVAGVGSVPLVAARSTAAACSDRFLEVTASGRSFELHQQGWIVGILCSVIVRCCPQPAQALREVEGRGPQRTIPTQRLPRAEVFSFALRRHGFPRHHSYGSPSKSERPGSSGLHGTVCDVRDCSGFPEPASVASVAGSGTTGLHVLQAGSLKSRRTLHASISACQVEFCVSWQSLPMKYVAALDVQALHCNPCLPEFLAALCTAKLDFLFLQHLAFLLASARATAFGEGRREWPRALHLGMQAGRPPPTRNALCRATEPVIRELADTA